MILSTIVIAAFLSQTAAQTCQPGSAQGPCLNGVCTAGSTCIVATNLCCPNTALIPAVTTLAPGVITANTIVTGVTPVCVDKLNPSTGVSDCPKSASLCNNAVYFALMTEQCPKTCGRCPGSNTTNSPSMCVDLVHPRTGVSDCPQRVSLCTNINYVALMRTQCPKTCGFCSTNGSTVTSMLPVVTSTIGVCVDKVNPSTGTSDCPQRMSLCTNTIYATLMREQCPKTCGIC